MINEELRDLPGGAVVKNPPANAGDTGSMPAPGSSHVGKLTFQYRRRKRHGFNPWVRKIPWRRQWQPTPGFLLRKSHGWRSLEGYSPWGCKESDITEVIEHAYIEIII